MANRWIPLESNPEVMNAWCKQAGLVTSQDQWEDIYGLDAELLAMVPQPVKAVVMLFPISEGYEARRKDEDEHGNEVPLDPTLVFIKQTISNACGTIGILHALANSNVTIAPESPLSKFIDASTSKSPAERAALLETTPLFADIHAAAAAGGQTAVPTDLNTDLHFTCFVHAPRRSARDAQIPEGSREGGLRLVELDGRRKGPVDRGPSTDLLKDVAKLVKEKYIANESSMQFSMMALCPQLDAANNIIGNTNSETTPSTLYV